MADFINFDAAYDIDSLTCWYISSVGAESPVWTDKHIEELLNDFYVIPKDTPAADVVPVVHCKNCEYNNECSVQDFGEMHQNDFCSRGKRRSDNEV